MFTPRAWSTSALPLLLETERLPCLATVTPAPATTTRPRYWLHLGLLLATVATTTVVWVTVTFLAPATERGMLVSFYKLVRPAGPGWTSVRAEAGVAASPDSPTRSLLGWVLGCVFVYAALFGTGSFLYGRTGPGLMWLAAFVVSGVSLIRLMPKLWGSATSG